MSTRESKSKRAPRTAVGDNQVGSVIMNADVT